MLPGLRSRIASSLLLLCVAAPASAEKKKLTLAELITLAQARSKLVAVARAELGVRSAEKREATYAWGPTGELTYLLTGVPRIECRGPNNDANPLTRTRDCVNTVNPANDQSVTVGNSGIDGVGMQGQLTLIQPIYTFGKIEAAIHAANHGIAANRALLEGARADAEVDATRAYWGLKAARAGIDTLGAVTDELVPWIAKIEKDLSTPEPHYTLTDLQRLQTALDELEVLHADLDRGVATALAGIRALINEEADVDEAELAAVELTERPTDYYEAAALTLRPEVRAVDEGAAAFRSLARLKRNLMLPDIGLVGSVLLRYASSIEDADSVFVEHATTARFNVFLGLRQPLDLFSRYAQYRHAEADAEVMSSKRDLVFVGIAFEVRQAHADLDSAKRRLAHLDHGQRIARSWLTAVKENLDIGIAETRDLADAARKYIELRLRYYEAIDDVNVTAAKLRRVSGTDVAKAQ